MDMKAMMRQAQKMQAELAKAQEEIKTMTFEGSAGGGMVKAVATGEMTIESVNRDAGGHGHCSSERSIARCGGNERPAHVRCDGRYEHPWLDVRRALHELRAFHTATS